MHTTKEYIQMAKLEDNIPLFRKFGFVGKTIDFDRKIKDLSKLAEPEEWSDDRENGILKNYIYSTFEKCVDDDIVLYDDDHENACFNTGLLTINGYDIVGWFQKNNLFGKEDFFPYWQFVDFVEISNTGFRSKFKVMPNLPNYFNDINELMLDFDTEIYMNYNHILDDNSDRLPLALRQLPRNAQVVFLEGAKKVAETRIKRNHRLVIPIYSMVAKRIHHLVPFLVFDDYLPVVVRKESNSYNAVTILSKEMAYKNARLIMKPETSWLIKKK